MQYTGLAASKPPLLPVFQLPYAVEGYSFAILPCLPVGHPDCGAITRIEPPRDNTKTDRNDYGPVRFLKKMAI